MAYRIFISHAWAYNETYWDIRSKLDAAQLSYSDFSYIDYSIPDHNPILNSRGNLLVGFRTLDAAIKTRIDQSSVILVPARMYIYHSDWVQREIDYAISANKRVIGVRSRAALRTPTELENKAFMIVDSNYRSLYNAIVR